MRMLRCALSMSTMMMGRVAPRSTAFRRCSAAAAQCWGLSTVAPCSAAPPAQLGDGLEAIDTPALVVDLDAFAHNCLKLKQVMEAFPGVSIRPHIKAHKCAQLAQYQLQLLGPAARGVCCQKVAEAEAMVAGGVNDVFVSNEVVAPSKITRLAALAAQGARVSVVVDAPGPLQLLAETAHRWGVSFDVLVEINAGQDRCGVDTPDAAAALAEQTAELSAKLAGAVNFAGLQAYHGGLQHVRDPLERAAAVHQVADKAVQAVAAIKRRAGLRCATVTGGGSGTYRLEAASGIFTEVQPGSFGFGDADYARNRQLASELDHGPSEWRQSLWVLTQVMSMSEGRACAVVDAGLKALSLDSGPPVLLEQPNVAAGLVAPPPGSSSSGGSSSAGGSSPRAMSFEGVEFANGGDEHGKLLFPQTLPWTQLPPIGTKLLLQPGHCDPTVNLYDEVVTVREGTVVGVWPVAARGPGR